MYLLGAFAASALFLAGVGVFGVFAGDVIRRRREIGIRLALGGRGARVIGLLIRESLLRAIAGIGIGTFVAVRHYPRSASHDPARSGRHAPCGRLIQRH